MKTEIDKLYERSYVEWKKLIRAFERLHKEAPGKSKPIYDQLCKYLEAQERIEDHRNFTATYYEHDKRKFVLAKPWAEKGWKHESWRQIATENNAAKSKIKEQVIRTEYSAWRIKDPTAKKTWIQERLTDKHRRKQGFSKRVIQDATKDLK
ncbi:MAG: hypothetical protein V2A34_11085 [Lentisphaerota bacterium]